MKQLHFILVFVILAASCAKIDIDNTSVQDEPIGFAQYTYTNTKAGDSFIKTGGSLPSGSSFGVFGFFHAQHSPSVPGLWKDALEPGATVTNHPNLMFNTKVTYDPTKTEQYEYNPKRFWPKNQMDRISFFAYYPYDDTHTIVDFHLSQNTNGLGGYTLEVPADPADHVDFMVSDLCPDQSKALWDASSHTQGLTGLSDGTVKFTFHHMLAQVRIKEVHTVVENPDVELTVNSISFIGIQVRGTCRPRVEVDGSGNYSTFLGSVDDRIWPDAEYSKQRADGSKGITLTLPSSGVWDGAADENVMLMIPQNLEGCYLEVNYTINRRSSAHGEWYSYGNNIARESLLIPNYSDWERNKIYNYVINLSPKGIKLDASVAKWIPSDGGIITISD